MEQFFKKIYPHSGKILATFVVIFFSFLAFNLYQAVGVVVYELCGEPLLYMLVMLAV